VDTDAPGESIPTDRAEGVSFWRVNGREVNGEDELTVGPDGVVSWSMAGGATGRVGLVQIADPGAARLARAVIREKERLVERERRRGECHPAPKPGGRKRRNVRVDLAVCPECDGAAFDDCPVCDGDGYVRIHS
jgi:hypothetical protein